MRNLLLLEQEHTSTKNDILPVFIGESGVGAGMLRHSGRTLPGETGKETGNRYRPILGAVHLPFASSADLTLIRRPQGSKKSGKKPVNR
jgi:hypothetical protein